MNEFQRDSAYMARGKYLMVMGDDAEMVTPNWNKILQTWEICRKTRTWISKTNYV